ncbi:MAG TPA: DNA polymerase/3'-5' exonuclease PolX [bacterium]|nr:DNA polymerase/3'-5' exonuclease PolX [bacterium]HPP29395.1 DNA polymerase/3'-5' exonuclease PolX [bacterium]
MGKNTEIADIFERIADALEFKGDLVFKINAYRKAARVLREYSGDISSIHPSEIEGIGKGMAEKIEEYLKTGKIKKYEEVIADIPDGLLELLNIPNLGPKTLQLLHKELGIKNIADLEKVIDEGKVAKLPGMGEKKAENIKKGILLYRTGRSRIPLATALKVVREVIKPLSSVSENISPAGSLRRMRETIGDIDILATGEKTEEIINAFVRQPYVRDIMAKGDTKASVRTSYENLQVDLRVVEKECWGAALLYFTGSKAHNIKLRGLAKERGLKISEYGIFKGAKRVAGRTEDDVYKVLGLDWIPPEIREDRGEIEAAIRGELPVLIEQKDIRGDIHIHSNYSDGMDEIETVVIAAKKMGYEYIGICDHSKTSKIAGGLDEDMLKRRNEEIDRVQEKIKGIRILKGMEVDILSDGSLDYSDSILEELDFVIAAVHQGFTKNVTERMKSAMDNPFVDIVAHPTGRLLSGREGYKINIEEVMRYAAKKGVALEINASYDRIDLNDVNIIKAKNYGVIFALGTDAHSTGMLKDMELGLGTARRGWLEKKDVLNTYRWDDIPLRRRKR